MVTFQQVPIAYGVKLIFEDGTVVNWYREGKRGTVHAEKNPHGHRLPASARSLDEITRIVAGEGEPDASLPQRDPEGRPVGAFDGGADPNPGPGGWGIVLPDGRELCGGEPQTTNNRMELTAAIHLLEETKGPLRAIGDSHYVIAGITSWIQRWQANGWLTAARKPVENRDLWQRLAELTEGRDIFWERVRGHTGHPLNERCDQLCAIGRRQARRRADRRS
jgi:ribonuclease HI